MVVGGLQGVPERGPRGSAIGERVAESLQQFGAVGHGVCLLHKMPLDEIRELTQSAAP